MRKKLFTDRVRAQISHWMRDDGLSAAQIAEKIGCTVGTLRVRCSQHGISLKTLSRSRKPGDAGSTRDPALPDIMLSLPQETRVRLQEHARLLGLSDADLVSALIETIDRDDLYSAVLDDSR